MTFTLHLDRTFIRDELQFSVRAIDPKARDDHFGTVPLSVRRPARWDALLDVLCRETERPTIIYTQSRSEADRLATELTEALGIECVAYHAGLGGDARTSAAERFMGGQCDLIVATSAFGMGIDKGDVRSVIHWQVPATPESLYQEAGRAGRGQPGQPARAVLLFHEADLDSAYQLVRRGSPTASEIRRLDLTLREVADQQSAGKPGQVARATITDGDITRLAGMRPDVDPRVALAHLERVGLVKELDRIQGARSLRRNPGQAVPTSTLETFILKALDDDGRCHGLVATDLAEMAGCTARDIQSAIRGMISRGLIEECRRVSLRLLSDDAEARVGVVRGAALAIWHEVEAHRESKGARRYLRGAGAEFGNQDEAIDAAEILSSFGLIDARHENVDGRIPAIRTARGADVGPLRDAFASVGNVMSATRGGGVVRLRELIEQTGLDRSVVLDSLTLAHLCRVASVDLRSWEDGGREVTRVVRILEVENRDDRIAEAEADSKGRARNQLLRLEALRRYAAIETDTDDDSEAPRADAHQAYLERYLTERDFLDQVALESAEDLLVDLTATQREVVQAPTDLPIVVVAGPGTGKTRTITHRIAFRSRVKLILPENILAVTFARAATEEMRVRLAQLNVRGVRVRTLHSIAAQLVMSNWRALGFDRRPNLLDRRTAQRLMGEAIGEAKERSTTPSDGSALPPDIDGELRALAGAKRECRQPTDLVGREFQRKMGEAGLIDYDDLPCLATQVINEHFATNFIAAVNEVYVDEFQDLSSAQIRLVDALGTNAHLTIVGDPRQAIYEWNGASPEYLLGRSTMSGDGVAVFNLVENFRSSGEVLDLANRTIRKVLPRLPALRLASRAAKPNFGVSMAEWKNDGDMLADLVEVVRGWLSEGVADQEIAVLVRGGKLVGDCQRALLAANVPVHGVGLPSLKSTYAYELLDAIVKQPEADEAQTLGAVEQMDKFEASSRVQAVLIDDTNRDDWERLRGAVAQAEERGAKDLAESLRRVSDDSDPAPSDRSGITVATIHKAKGLEWDAVAMVGVGSKAMADFKAEEEMCRLLYVAITRSRGRLSISWAGKPTRWLA